MSVLVVDDDAAVREVHTRVLERAGYQVVAVDNGIAAYAELQRRRFDAILCDIQMPFLEGRRFYEELVADFPGEVRRMVFVTGWATAPGIREFLEREGVRYLQKPADAAELVRAVRAVAPHAGPPAAEEERP